MNLEYFGQFFDYCMDSQDKFNSTSQTYYDLMTLLEKLPASVLDVLFYNINKDLGIIFNYQVIDEFNNEVYHCGDNLTCLQQLQVVKLLNNKSFLIKVKNELNILKKEENDMGFIPIDKGETFFEQSVSNEPLYSYFNLPVMTISENVEQKKFLVEVTKTVTQTIKFYVDASTEDIAKQAVNNLRLKKLFDENENYITETTTDYNRIVTKKE